jgi:hypothetical protein
MIVKWKLVYNVFSYIICDYRNYINCDCDINYIINHIITL